MNYVSAHDNFTLWDKLVLSMYKNNDFKTKYPDVLAANKLAAFIYFTSQGNLFLQAGEEFGRTKFGEGNSYCSAPEINMLQWHQTIEFADLVEYYKGLIRLRKKLPGLYDKSALAVSRIIEKDIHKDGVVSFQLDNRSDNENDRWDRLLIVYNAAKEDYMVTVPKGKWEVLADGSQTNICKAVDKEIQAKAQSGMLLGRKVE